MNNPKVTSVDAYIAGFPKDVQKILEQLRTIIKKAAPEAEELISYNMPAYKYFGVLVYFAAYKNHIGFYPGASGIKAFIEEVSIYKNAKGSVQFPIGKALPVSLVIKIVKFKVKEKLEKAKAKKIK